MSKLRVNAPVDQATPLLERFSTLSAELAAIEANRGSAIAETNQVADRIALPIVTEMDAIRAELEPWWKRKGSTLLKGKRKSIELGGCKIGSKAGSTSLQFTGGDDKAALAALLEHRWAKPFIRVSSSVDKTAVKEGLEGKRGEGLKALGFSVPVGAEQFILERAEQSGTVGAFAG